MSMFTTAPTFGTGASSYVTIDEVKSLLQAAGPMPPDRLGHLAMKFSSGCGSVEEVHALIARVKAEVPEAFEGVPPVPQAEVGVLAAADRVRGAAGSVEAQAAMARRAQRETAEADLMARVAAVVKAVA